MTDLSGPGVRVLLIATAHHGGPLLTSVPSVATSFRDLKNVLIERCGVRDENLRPLLDPADAQTMARAVTEEAQRADSVLLVWFIGHGLLGPEGELYLAAGNTDRLTPGMAEHQALSFSSLRQALGASRASSVVVVLDCCFSGRASLGGEPSTRSFAMAPAHGMYLMGSAEQLALAPPDMKHTAFTGAVIELLTEGEPRGLPQLTLDAVFDGVFRLMSDRQRPLPRRQAGDRSGQLVIAPNPAVAAQHEPPDETEPAQRRCPYPGLDAFRVDDADVFFGRDRMTERLLDRLETVAETDEPGPLVLVGPSGSGKSSLLNAGLAAALRERGLLGSTSWLTLRLTPGRSPLQRLATQLGAVPETVDVLREDPGRAAELGERLTADRPEQRLIVLVDQLEEVFTLCTAAERTAFLRALTALTRPSDEGRPGTLVVLALRADFYGQAAAHPELLTALRDTQLLVEPMTTGELRAAIEGPAAAAGLALDGGFADVILHEFGTTGDGQPAAGALPLLSHVLWATWTRRTGSRLTVAQYRATGGIEEAIKTTAEETYEALDPAGREAARLMLPRLVRVGEGSTDTAGLADRAELLHGLPDTAQPVDRSELLYGLPDTGAAQEAIDRFTRARLLTLDHATVRISHEALLRTWPRLREWVDADRDWLRARQQLAADAVAWERAGRDSSLLYRGNRLAAVRERAASAPASAVEPDSVLAEFLDTSWRRERRGVRRLRTTVAILTTLVLLAGTGLFGSYVFQRRAERASDRDLARYLSAEAEGLRSQQPGLAKQLSLLSYRIDHEAGRGALLNSRTTPGVINAEEPAYDLAYSGDGRILAISVGDAIELRFPDGSTRVGTGVIGPVTVSRDGRTLAAIIYDKHRSKTAWVRIWDLSDPRHPRQTAAPRLDHAVHALALSPDGRTLYGGQTTGEIHVWDIADRTAPRPLPTLRAHSTRVDSLAVSPRRDLLASMSLDGRIQLWNTTDPQHPEPVTVLQGEKYDRTRLANAWPLHRVAFDPAGRILAAPVTKKTHTDLALWRLDVPAKPQRMRPKSGPTDDSSVFCSATGMTSVAFSPIREYAVGTCDGTWHTWIYARTVVPGAILSGATGGSVDDDEAGTVLFDPGTPRRLLQATQRGVHVSYLDNSARLGAQSFLPSTPGTGGQFDYRKVGNRSLIALQGVGVNYLWDVTELPDSAVLRGTTLSPDMFTGADIALSPDGRLLADVEVFEGKKADKKGKKQQYVGVRLRDTAVPPRGAPLSTIEEDLVNGVQALAFSPTAPILAVSDMNGWRDMNRKAPVVRIYDIANPRRPRQIARIEATTTELDFSPDGETLILTDSPFTDPEAPQPAAEDELEGWDLTDPTRPRQRWARPVPDGTDSPNVVFRPDGKLLATYDGGGTLKLWRFEGNRLTDELSRLHVSRYAGPLAFSPDGTHLALLGQNPVDEFDRRPEIWDVTDPKAPERQYYLPPADSGDVYALRFSPDGEFLALVRASAGIELWATRPERDIDDLCASAGDPITPQQWKQYLPDRPYQPPCQ